MSDWSVTTATAPVVHIWHIARPTEDGTMHVTCACEWEVYVFSFPEAYAAIDAHAAEQRFQ
jgi:hypothetical protein